MRPTSRTLALFLILAGGVAVAGDAQNPAVQARMDAMGKIAAHTKVLGDMASGKTAHDAAAAEAAAAGINAAALTVPALFEAPETDPESEAKPEIWSDFADFSAKAEALATVAGSVDASSLDGVRVGMGQIGEACKSCHSLYRL